MVTEHTEVWTWETRRDGGAAVRVRAAIVDGIIVLWKDYWDFQTLMGAAPAAWHERLDTADLSLGRRRHRPRLSAVIAP